MENQSERIIWQPWSDETFKKAKNEEKPVLLSIGAKWCHWCHVMKEECFEDPQIADFINQNYIPIKIDRDQRPDIDKIYQQAISVLSEQGGWPLTVFLTDEKEPFFGGTYFPKEDRKDMQGFLGILQEITKLYRENRNHVIKTAQKTTALMKDFSISTRLEGNFDKNIITRVVEYLIDHTDLRYGGFGYSPKFPQPEHLKLMLNDYISRKNEKSAKALKATLYGMAKGGYYDHIRGGFHRYSIDTEWRIPHFEKILSDNLLLLDVYLSAYKVAKNQFYKEIFDETLKFIMDEFYDDSGFFYASIDADSVEGEGDYYAWSKDELQKTLDSESYEIFCKYYNITDEGNFRGKNILYVTKEFPQLSIELGIAQEICEKKIAEAKKFLLNKREQRAKPKTDRTAYTSTNALAISAFIHAYKITKDEKYLHIAKQTANFMLKNLVCEEKLYHSLSDEKNEPQSFLDDYSYTIQAMLDLYEVSFEERYLKNAINFANDALEIFQSKRGALYYAPKTKEEIFNEIPIYDAILPSPNSIMGLNFTRLYYLTYYEKYLESADNILRSMYKSAEGDFVSCSSYFFALYRLLNEPQINIITGAITEEEVSAFVLKLAEKPNLNMINLLNDGSRDHALFEGKVRKEGKVTVYICKDKVCMEPITDTRELEAIEGPGLINVR